MPNIQEQAATIQEALKTNSHLSPIRGLVVEACEKTSTLIIRGDSPSFYRKQMAQHHAIQLADGILVKNLIEVQ